jgi:hypothetical protein
MNADPTSEATTGGSSPDAVFVGVGITEYDEARGLKRLPKAVEDVESIAAILGAAPFDLAVSTSLDDRRDVLITKLNQALPKNGLAGRETTVVVLWAGHGKHHEATDSLQLFLRGNSADDPIDEAFAADQLAARIARSGASQILVLLDTCRSGSAGLDVARVMDNLHKKLVAAGQRWVGIVASSQDYQNAIDGAFAAKLRELLEKGPKDRTLRLRWSSYQAWLRGDDLVDALVREWEDDPARQAPKPLQMGLPWLLLKNPLYRPGQPDQVVEHLLLAAQGRDQTEEGIWFTGREAPLRTIVEWIGRREPGLCVLTGPAGTGKSAIAGRIVSLSSAIERDAIQKARGLPAPDLDPGQGAVRAHIHARRLDTKRLAAQLMDALGIEAFEASVGHHDVLAWAARQSEQRRAANDGGSPIAVPLIVVDGLDEAESESSLIATELLAPLAQHAQVLVATRDIAGEGEAPSLLDQLGPPAVTIDLGADPEATEVDIDSYTRLRLEGADPEVAMDLDLVAEEIVALTSAATAADGGPFLLARLITSQLRAAPVDTTDPAWRAQLAHSVEQAFERDLATGRDRVRGDVALPHAGMELLTALAYAYGRGFPDDVWAVAATALSPTGISYTRDDVLWALREHGRYITASGESGQAVYRMAHQRLVDLYQQRDGIGRWATVREGVALRLTEAFAELYRTFLDNGHKPEAHPYLWSYLWRHASDAGPAGIAFLEPLAMIVITIAEERELQLRALTQLAIARVASGELTQAIDLIEQVRDASKTTTPIVIDITDAIQRFPEHSADLAQLIQVVAAPSATED